MVSESICTIVLSNSVVNSRNIFTKLQIVFLILQHSRGFVIFRSTNGGHSAQRGVWGRHKDKGLGVAGSRSFLDVDAREHGYVDVGAGTWQCNHAGAEVWPPGCRNTA